MVGTRLANCSGQANATHSAPALRCGDSDVTTLCKIGAEVRSGWIPDPQGVLVLSGISGQGKSFAPYSRIPGLIDFLSHPTTSVWDSENFPRTVLSPLLSRFAPVFLAIEIRKIGGRL